MQPINETLIDRLPAATPEMKPLCFPGKYPTRLWVRTGTQVYLGKPTVEIVQNFAKALLSKGNVEFIEFDRHAKFFGYANHAVLGTPGYFAWYHPNVSMSVLDLHTWLGKPFHTLRIEKHVFYSTQPKSHDPSLIAQMNTLLHPQMRPKPAEPKPTRARPRSSDFSSYAAYMADYTKWKQENAEYLAARKVAKERAFANLYYTTKVTW